MDSELFIDRFRTFNRYYANMLSGFDRNLYGNPFTLVEDRVVTEIWDAKVTSPNDISSKLNLNKGQLSKILSKLEKHDVIARSLNPADKRSILVKLTAHGKELQRTQVHKVQTGLDTFINQFTAGQLTRMASSMNVLQNTLATQHKIKLEQAGLKDIGYIADVHARVYTARGFKPIFQYYVLAALAEYAKSEMDGITLIATVDGVSAGTVSLVEADNGYWQVRWVAVDPAYQGHGLGKKLIAALMQYAQEHDITKMYLWTLSELKAARHIYGQNGFHLVETKENHEWKDHAITEERWDYQKPNQQN